ncbi:MAG TPA: ABC transporter ATP-binding protein [Anaerolineaceae bacterium]|uniref:Putative ABC transporter ATP-binding protein n=1 Tax=Anaerolinea thermophila TaxID=167964 RepID=A0A124FN55_9CHLR|nr:MAG: Putative ABC transporter ATP-binding protein [Anaerolinea thermophila]HAF60881.1 ABC transporter ATP-binding protein [Anaerolineaceae bacterium]
MDIISLQQVAFQYNGGFALQDVSFQVQKGEVFALLGPNGAGKTTTIRLLNGLLRATSGEIRVLGCDPLKDGIIVRGKTGVLTETPALYERLTALENMQFFGTLNGMAPADLKARIAELLDFFDLAEHADQRVGTYSRGMRQRLAIARALLHRPELLFLDEPTSNLDPEIAHQVQDLIIRVKKEENCSVVICTHRLYEAEQVCDRAAIMHKGRLLAQGTLAELREAAGLRKRVRFTLRNELTDGAWRQLLATPFVEEGEQSNPNAFILDVEDYATVPEIVAWLVQYHIDILSVTPQQPSLEEVYFQLQKRVEVQCEF